MNKLYNLLILNILIIGFSAGLYAQDIKTGIATTEFIESLSTKFHQKKAEAIRWAEANNQPIRQEFEDGRIVELMLLDDKGMPIYYTTHNANGATVIKSDKVYPGGGAGLSLTGAGQKLGMWDGGDARSTHNEFTGRLTNKNSPSPNGTSNHATHVAGTMMASGAWNLAKGMSYAATLDAYDWNNDEAEMANAAANDNIRVSQHSYGIITGWASGNWSGNSGWHWFGNTSISQTEDYNWGFYSNQARDWDFIAKNAPNYLIVKSAGNDRNYGPAPGTSHYVRNPSNNWNWELSTTVRDLDGGATGFGSISYSGVSKNIVTVGAVANTGVMSNFSGWGPTDDGRIKPDIVAKGVSVLSPIAFNADTPSDVHYGTLNGTSMSGPMVSGSVGLLLEHQQNLHPGNLLLSSTMKALILHTADDLGRPGPDYEYGWGMMNTEKAAAVMTANAATPIHIFEQTLNNGGQIKMLVKANGTNPLQATLVWTDVPGTPPAASLNPANLMLVNDLDIRITPLGGSAFEPFVLDPANPTNNATTGDNFRDNVEVVLIASPIANQLYEITISHKGSLSGGNQVFSLIVTGNKAINQLYLAQSHDNGANYGGTWNNSDNEGYGFGNWSLSNGTSNGFSGWFIGNPANAGISGMDANSFGLFANPSGPGNYVNADRAFAAPLAVGSTFSLEWGVNWDSNGAGNKGFNLYTGGTAGTQIINVNMGGNAQITINGNPMFNNYGTNAMTLSFEYVSAGNLRVFGTGRNGNETYDQTLAVSGPPDAVRFYANDLASGDQRQPYFNNLTITPNLSSVPANATAYVVGKVQQNAHLTVEDMIIAPGNELVVESGRNLTVSATLANNGTLLLKSDATATASLLHNSNNVPATIERYITGNTVLQNTYDYHLVSVPLNAGVTAAQFLGSYLYRFDVASQNWASLGTSLTTPLPNDQGYMIFYPNNFTTYNFVGQLNNGSFTAATPIDADHFALVPNPYPSAIDWDAASGWTKSNIRNAVWIWNPVTDQYATYGSYVGVNAATQYIPAGQAFFVKSNAASPVLSMNNNVRLHNSQAFFKSGQQMSDLLRIHAHGNNKTDEIVLLLREGSLTGLDDFDVDKLFGAGIAPQLFTTTPDGRELAINNIPADAAPVSIPMGFQLQAGGQVNLSVEGLDTFKPSLAVMLEDLLTGTTINLRETPTYSFNHSITNSSQRFRLHLTSITALDDNWMSASRIWTDGRDICIAMPETESQSLTIELFDPLGRNLATYRRSSQPFIRLSAPASGVMLVRISNDKGAYSSKVFIR